MWKEIKCIQGVNVSYIFFYSNKKKVERKKISDKNTNSVEKIISSILTDRQKLIKFFLYIKEIASITSILNFIFILFCLLKCNSNILFYLFFFLDFLRNGSIKSNTFPFKVIPYKIENSFKQKGFFFVFTISIRHPKNVFIP